MPANQVSGAVGYLVGSATALALSIGPQQAPAGGSRVRRVLRHRLQCDRHRFCCKIVKAAKSVRSGCETVGENYTGVCPTSVSLRWTWIQILTSLAARSWTFLGTVLVRSVRVRFLTFLMSWWWVEKMPNRSKPTYFALKHLF